MNEPTLTQVAGIGPATARLLAANGLTSVAAIANASIAEIAAVPGFGPTRAAAIKQAAQQLETKPEPTVALSTAPKKKKKRKKKAKDKKKKKKDGKGKGKDKKKKKKKKKKGKK